MPDWDDYRFALAIKRAGTIRGAATMLGVSHGTVSRRLADITAKLGSPIFDRIDGTYRPSRHGEPFIAAAMEMEKAAFTADRHNAGLETEMRGTLRISMPDVFAQRLLMKDIIELQSIYPNIQLTIHSSLNFVDLDYREADIVIRITHNAPEHLVGRRLFPYMRSYYASIEYLEDCRSQTRPYQWIGWPDDTEKPEWVAESPFPDAPIGIRVDTPLERHEAAIQGAGLIFEACLLGDTDPRLTRIPGASASPDRDIWVLTHPDMKDTPKIRVFLRALVKAISSKRDLIQGRII